MQASFDSTALIQEVQEDIVTFGASMNVYAVYSYLPSVDREFITDYVYKDAPTRDEADTAEEYQILMRSHQQALQTLVKTKHQAMTLQQLLALLQKQNQLLQ